MTSLTIVLNFLCAVLLKYMRCSVIKKAIYYIYLFIYLFIICSISCNINLVLKRAERREQGIYLYLYISEVGTTFIFLLFIWAQTLQDGRTYVFCFSIWTFLGGKMTSQDWQPYLEILSFNKRPPWKVYRFVACAAHVNALGNRRSRSDLALVINLFLYHIGFGERSCLATNSPRRIDAIQYDFMPTD